MVRVKEKEYKAPSVKQTGEDWKRGQGARGGAISPQHTGEKTTKCSFGKRAGETQQHRRSTRGDERRQHRRERRREKERATREETKKSVTHPVKSESVVRKQGKKGCGEETGARHRCSALSKAMPRRQKEEEERGRKRGVVETKKGKGGGSPERGRGN